MKKLIFFFIGILLMATNSFADNTKQPNVAGQFYPGSPARLGAMIDQFLTEATVTPTDKDVKIIIAPHAGYVYSGGVAAYGYKAVSQKKYKTVVILAPSHFFGFDGVSVWNEGAFQTPLGLVPVDSEMANALIATNKNFSYIPQAFNQEHSLEVQLPFIQKTLGEVKIVPVIVGQIDLEVAKALAESLAQLTATRDDVLIVVSSDMSHYHQSDVARNMDRESIETIEKGSPEDFFNKSRSRKIEMCGWLPVTTALLLAKMEGLTAEDLRYLHSGDVTGEMDRVVGYTSVMFYKPTGSEAPATQPTPAAKSEDPKPVEGVLPLTKEEKQKLIKIAKDTIQKYVTSREALEFSESDPRLSENEGAFVTLHKRGQLRGCIGHIIGDQPLYLTVRDMAIASSTEDPRFKPVTSAELAEIDIEISVLSKPRICTNVEEIVMGKHGVIVKQGPFRQGVFLPQVAVETGWSREEFLSQLCSQKAGLPADAWKNPSTQIYVFTADVFSEKDVAK